MYQNLIQPIDGGYFTSTYFIVSTVLVLIMACASMWGEFND